MNKIRNKIVKSNKNPEINPEIKYWAKLYNESVGKDTDEEVNEVVLDIAPKRRDGVSKQVLINSIFSYFLEVLAGDKRGILKDPSHLDFIVNDYETAHAAGVFKITGDDIRRFTEFKKRTVQGDTPPNLD